MVKHRMTYLTKASVCFRHIEFVLCPGEIQHARKPEFGFKHQYLLLTAWALRESPMNEGASSFSSLVVDLVDP